MISAGIDAGTGYVKAVIVDGQMIKGSAVSVCGNLKDSVDAVYSQALKASGIKKRDVKKIIATGYGGGFVKGCDFRINKQTCLVKAATVLDKSVRMVIDVGALFIKVITINEDGFLDDNIENDICAAGSGKFLELISQALDVPVSSFSDYANLSAQPYSISSSCAVFAESEVISKINSGLKKEDIIAGVLDSLVNKVISLTGKAGMYDGNIFLSGGVSRIQSFCDKLENALNAKIIDLPFEPIYLGAYGAALFT